MLISVFYLINQSDPITKLKNSYDDAEFKISSYSNKGIVDKELDEISDIEGIKILSKVKESTVDMDVSKKMLTEKGYSYFEAESKRDKFKSKLLEEGIYRFNPRVYGYSNEQLESLKRWVIDGSIDIEEMNKRSTAILIQNLNDYNYTQIKAGDKIKIGVNLYDKEGNNSGYSSKEFEIGAIVSEEGVNISDGMLKNSILVSYDVASGYQKIDIGFDKNENYNEVELKLKNNISSIADAKMESFKDKLAETKRNNIQLIFILYSFVFIVGIVSIINLINIMKMNVITRSKEIGMLRAIGLGEDEVRKMIKVEGFIYGVTASILGSTLGCMLTYFIHKKLVPNTTWKFTFMIIIICVATITITTLSSLIASRRLFKSSIVDSIRSIE